ncbi:MAG: family 43 glycosylhydrolase [Acidobacteriaceae bacterium]
MDLAYRFRMELPSRREAADPTMVVFHNKYWLFPSKSGGYWYSGNLLDWKFVASSGYPVEDYAPTAVVIAGKLYLTAGGTHGLFSTDDPASGRWRQVADFGRSYTDPDLFLDDDGHLYVYYGASGTGPLSVTELNRKNRFKPLRTKEITSARDPMHRGWEVPGDHNELLNEQTWIEGSWMTKHGGKYYLQYAAPGTEYKSYADGVLLANRPMGPFTYAPYSPFSAKPTGFIAGAGHGSTFQGLDGEWWHVGTMTVSVRHMFERRLGLFPSFFEPDGQLVTDTYLGDYPHRIGGNRGLAGWMLLSYGKPVIASSTLTSFTPEKAVDENIRTWWSAKSGNAGEWFQVDLGAGKRIDAVQINFADLGSTALGRLRDTYRYKLEVSNDGSTWRTIVDHSKKGRDSVDDYEPLEKATDARYVKIVNFHMPAGALFSLSGLRVFGNGLGHLPMAVTGITAQRDSRDGRRARIEWQPVENADFYIVRFGLRPDRMFQNYQVYKSTHLDLRSLTIGVSYAVTVDAVNENGIRRVTSIIEMK